MNWVLKNNPTVGTSLYQFFWLGSTGALAGPRTYLLLGSVLGQVPVLKGWWFWVVSTNTNNFYYST